MTNTVYPVDAVSNAPAFTGRKLRQATAALAAGATAARPLGGFSGVRPGSGTVGSATSTTWTVTPHAGQLDLQAAAEAGVYLYAIDANVTGAVTAADANNPRVDIVYLTLNDPAEGDGSTAPGVVAGYLAGSPAASPVAPATPARSMVLYTIAVPKAGGGSPTVTMAAMEVGAAGSPVGVRSKAQRDALTTTAGLQVKRLDAAARIETFDGTGWLTEVYSMDTVVTTNGNGEFSLDTGLTTILYANVYNGNGGIVRAGNRQNVTIARNSAGATYTGGLLTGIVFAADTKAGVASTSVRVDWIAKGYS